MKDCFIQWYYVSWSRVNTVWINSTSTSGHLWPLFFDQGRDQFHFSVNLNLCDHLRLPQNEPVVKNDHKSTLLHLILIPKGRVYKNEKGLKIAEMGIMPDDHFIGAKPHHVNKNRRFTQKMRSDNYKINLIYLKENKYY